MTVPIQKLLGTSDTVNRPNSTSRHLSQPTHTESCLEAGEHEPLLQPAPVAPTTGEWSPPAGFEWIQVAIMSNVFLYGFDGTITAATYAVISSEFDAANTASWLTTAYLVTSTAFQPLYGRFSDIFGRRVCFFVSSITFGLGCLGCGLASNIILLNCMRALTGFGGGGLMTMGECLIPHLMALANKPLTPLQKPLLSIPT